MHSFQYYKAFLGHIVWILSVLYSCSSPSNTLPYNDEVHCGGEKLDSSSNFLVASNFSAIRFHGADIRDTNRSYTGRYSLQTNQANPYAFSLNLNDVKHGDFYEISIWRYGTDSSGFIVFSAEDPSLFYVKENRSLIVDSSGWELILLKVSIPYGLDNQSFKIYAWNSDSSQVWFDDLRIFKFEKEVFPEYSQDALSIYIDPEDMRKLNDKRRQAIRQGLLETEDDDWVDAIVFYGKIEMPAQVRLKGDWLDHLQGQKWSFRIKLKKGFTWNGMRTFSVQNPETRYFLFEWTAHEIFRSQDVLTTRYGFVPIMLNGISLGIYAYEEHFEKYLIEYNRRREGLIVKFSDEELWTVRRLQSTLKEPGLSMPDFDASSCIPFKASSIENDPALHEQFKMAQNLMWQYKNGLQTASLIFDVEKLARYFALQDIVRGFHALVWHNQRWYYNPALCRLEPILFDAYTSAGRYGWGGKNLSGDLIDEQINTNSPHLAMLYRLFQDKQFVEKYIYYLHKYTQVGFMENVMQQLNPQLKAYESQIKQEFPFYAYDYDFIVRQTAIIRRDLPAFEQRWKQDPRYAVRDSILHDNSEYDSLFHEDLPVKYVKAFSEVVHPDTMRIQIANYYTRNIVILGTGKNDYRIDYFILDKVSVPKYDKTLSSVDIASNPKVNFLFFMVEGIQQTLSVPILNWPAPQDYSSAQELLANSVFPYDGMYVVLSDSTVRFHKGRFSVNKTVVIPSVTRCLYKAEQVLISKTEQVLYRTLR